jgi:hypothetical protein
MGRIRPKTVSKLMDVANKFAVAKTPIITKGRDHPKMTDLTVIATRSAGLAITIAIIHIAR